MPSIYIIAGEASGDVLGGRLISSLKELRPDLEFHGIGGDMMQGEGIKSLFPINDLSLMGLIEIVPKLSKLIQRVYQTVNDIADKQPDIVITIDSPDFCKRVAKRARKKCPQTKFIHYVAPTVWAWREGRAKTMAKLFDGLICLFPFEPPYFQKYNLNAQFCGHPAIETIPQNNFERTNDHILIFPGSRSGEVKRMAPIFRDVYQKMKGMNPDLQARVVALPHLKEDISEEFFGLNIAYVDPQDRYLAMKEAPFALAKSGTTGLELAIAECPHIIAYKMHPVTWRLLRKLLKIKYAHIINIMEDEEIIPECIQDRCNSEDIIHAVLRYKNPDLSKIRQKLNGNNPSLKPSQQAAQYILGFL